MCYVIEMLIKYIFIVLFASVSNVQTAKILGVFSIPSISHQIVFRKLTLELAKRGHDVTVVTTDPIDPEEGVPDNYKEINMHAEAYETFKNCYQSGYKISQNLMSLSEIHKLQSVTYKLFEAEMKSPQIIELISNKTNSFDLIFVESLSSISLAYSHIFPASVILISSLGAMVNVHEIIGSSTHPLLYPTYMNRRIYNLSVWEKIVEIYVYFSFKYMFYLTDYYDTKSIHRMLGSDFPSKTELYDNVDMLFLNIHPIWANNQPVPPNVIYMGSLHQQPQSELPEDLKKYLDSSRKGVIYLSFGTNVLPEMLSQDKIDVMVKVLSSLPYDVLWKWDQDLPGRGDNIRISKWYPQSDLLRHPNVKLFITQAGLQSTDEAVQAGVPLVAIPMLNDQWYNAEMYVRHGIGAKLDIDTLTVEGFQTAIETVINSDSYIKNIIKLREMLNASPQSPLERAVWWTEHVIRHGGAKHLRPPTANISFAEYYEVKLVLTMLTLTVSMLILFLVLMSGIYRFLRQMSFCKTKIKTN